MENLRVLLVDDEEELVATLVERLTLRGIVAEAVTNGEEALRRMRDAPFDVVVADLKMPGISGLTVIERIQRDYPQTKVLLITGHGADADGLEEAAATRYTVLMKPFDIQALTERIREALQR